MSTETTPAASGHTKSTEASPPDRFEETAKGFDVHIESPLNKCAAGDNFTRYPIPFGMGLRQLLFWGICRLTRTVHAVWYTLRRMCKWEDCIRVTGQSQ